MRAERTHIGVIAAGALALFAPALSGCSNAGGGGDLRVDSTETTVTRADLAVAHPAIALDRRGRNVYVAWTVYPSDTKARTYVAASHDSAGSFDRPVQLGGDYEDHPVLRVADDGTLLAAWTHWNPKTLLDRNDPYSTTANAMVARSTDRGESFSKPIVVPRRRDTSMTYFLAVSQSPDGRDVTLGWLDYAPTYRPGFLHGLHEGAPFYSATSNDSGMSFSQPRLRAKLACVCCMPTGYSLNGHPGFVLRGLERGDVRNPMSLISTDDGSSWKRPAIIHRDNFKLKVCPHVGLGSAVGPDRKLRTAWWTGAEGRKGVWFAKSSDGTSFTSPVKVTDLAIDPHDNDVGLATDALGNSWVTTAWPQGSGADRKPTVSVWGIGSDDRPVKLGAADTAGQLPDVAAADRGAVLVWVRKRDVLVRRLGMMGSLR